MTSANDPRYNVRLVAKTKYAAKFIVLGTVLSDGHVVDPLVRLVGEIPHPHPLKQLTRHHLEAIVEQDGCNHSKHVLPNVAPDFSTAMILEGCLVVLMTVGAKLVG